MLSSSLQVTNEQINEQLDKLAIEPKSRTRSKSLENEPKLNGFLNKPKINQITEKMRKRLQFAKFKILLGWEDYTFDQCVELYKNLTPEQVATQRETIVRNFPSLAQSFCDADHQKKDSVEAILEAEFLTSDYSIYLQLDDAAPPLKPRLSIDPKSISRSCSTGSLPTNPFLSKSKRSYHPYKMSKSTPHLTQVTDDDLVPPQLFFQKLNAWRQKHSENTMFYQESKICLGCQGTGIKKVYGGPAVTQVRVCECQSMFRE